MKLKMKGIVNTYLKLEEVIDKKDNIKSYSYEDDYTNQDWFFDRNKLTIGDSFMIIFEDDEEMREFIREIVIPLFTEFFEKFVAKARTIV